MSLKRTARLLIQNLVVEFGEGEAPGFQVPVFGFEDGQNDDAKDLQNSSFCVIFACLCFSLHVERINVKDRLSIFFRCAPPMFKSRKLFPYPIPW